MMLNSTFSHPLLDRFAPVFTDLMKEPWAKFGFPFFIFFLLFQHHRKASFGIFLSLLLCLGFSDMTASQVFKKTIQRERPFQLAKAEAFNAKTSGTDVNVTNVETPFYANQRCPAKGYSFPSNHAVNMFALAGFLLFFLPHWFYFFMVLAIITAWTRVYCGVHFPFDVLAGALYGFMNGFLFSRFTRWWLSYLYPLRPKSSVRSSLGNE